MKIRCNSGAIISLIFAGLLVGACTSTPTTSKQIAEEVMTPAQDYRIGPGDSLEIFVWEHADLSVAVPVRPDGKISTPLVEDMKAEGKTPSELSEDILEKMSKDDELKQ